MAEYDPSNTAAYDIDLADENDGEEQYEEAEDSAHVQNDADAEDEDEDYDPSSFNFDEGAGDAQSTELMKDAQSGSPPAPTTATDVPPPTKPKTVGGFLVDDDDEEEEAEEGDESAVQPPLSQLNGTTGAHSGLGDASVAAGSHDVPIASEPQDTAAVLSAQSLRSNGPTPVVPPSASNASPSSIPASAPSFNAQISALPASDQGEQSTPVQSATATPQPPPTISNVPSQPSRQPQPTSSLAPASNTQRLPHDKVGQLEDRIKEDPKGDREAWRTLISHYREKGQLDQARKIYSRFLEVFPSAASIWVEYAQLELENDNLQHVEQIFGQSLLQLPNVDMWTLYMDYLRRIHPINPDPDGSKRGIISAAFDFLLDNVGIDPESGNLWREYVDFVKSGPGVIGGTGWQDAQKMDLVRKAYQRAVKLPHSELTKLWKEYDNFELQLNKATGRKHLQENSPSYMAARSAKNQLDQKMEGLDRTSIPVLPPIYGCAGDDYFNAQVDKWRAWIAWEKEDPISYKDEEDFATFRKRVIYAYKQATMQLRFYPEIWFDAATWCFEEGTEDMVTEGESFLTKGIEANPESVLLALFKADRVESNLETGNSDEVAIRNGEKLDPVYDGVSKPLYALRKKTEERIQKEIANIQERYANMSPEEDEDEDAAQADDDRSSNAASRAKPRTRAEQMKEEIDTYKSRMGEYTKQLRKTISYVWVAKMRAFRRIQGQGQPGKAKKGLRGVFAEARPQGQLTSAVYIASAQMEWACYRDPSAQKIFDRGYKLFPEDEVFTLEYIKHLINNNDAVNASATFQTFISRIKNSGEFSQEQKREKCRPILEYMHEYESNYGDLNQIHKVEKEMAELYPGESDLARFGARNALPSFNAMRAQLIISPTQILPKAAAPTLPTQPPYPSIEQPMSPTGSSHIRLGPNGPYIASPKRALDDSDSEAPSRKFMRGESPAKGMASRRIGTQPGSGQNAAGGSGGFMTKNYVPPSTSAAMPMPMAAPTFGLPMEIYSLLSKLPNAMAYSAFSTNTFDPYKIVEYLRTVDPSRARFNR